MSRINGSAGVAHPSTPENTMPALACVFVRARVCQCMYFQSLVLRARKPSLTLLHLSFKAGRLLDEASLHISHRNRTFSRRRR